MRLVLLLAAAACGALIIAGAIYIGTTGSRNSNIVACASTYTYGHTIVLVTVLGNSTSTKGSFNPLGTVTTTFTRTAGFSTSPGSVATIPGLGLCTFQEPQTR